MNTQFIKTINNNTYIKARKNIIVSKLVTFEDPNSNESTSTWIDYSNPTDEMLFEDGWELYVPDQSSEEETLERLIYNEREHRKFDIELYDASENVNVFYIQDMPIWLDKAMRTGLMLRFNSELAMERENTTLWYNGMSFTLPLSSAIQMLYALEVYASECYDNTQLHLANVEKLETLEEIQEYDYRVGYPEKLRF